MMRLIIAAVLFISLFAMMRGVSTTWRENRLSSPAVVKKTAKPVATDNITPEKTATPPMQPGKLPDLKVGYLFNADRLLVGDGDRKKAEDLAASNDLGIQTDIKSVVYSGSIIGDNLKQAIIVVPGAKKRQAAKRRSIRRKKSLSRGSKNIQNVRVKEGDLLSGYTVASISPEKIVFKKGNEQVEKLLYDPDKKRTAPSRQSRKPIPRAQVMARPARTPPSPVSRQLFSRPVSGRRLVVPRRPPARPDTSRVARRGRRSGSLRSPVAMPPMPVIHH